MEAALSPQALALLADAVEWRLLSLLFEYPSQEWRSRLSALLPSVAPSELRAMGEAALRHSTEGLHNALFGPAGSVPVREVTYQGGVQFGYLMAEISAFYSAFGYEPRLDEADDHISVQLGFLAFLKLKQVHALIQNEEGHAELASEAAANFIRDHLAVQAEPVFKRLEDFAPEYLVDAGRRILALAGPAPQSNYPLGDGAAGIEDNDSMSCGPSAANDDFIQIQP